MVLIETEWQVNCGGDYNQKKEMAAISVRLQLCIHWERVNQIWAAHAHIEAGK